MIHSDSWWNPAAQDQAIDRAYRIGQRASVQVYKLIVKDTIEKNFNVAIEEGRLTDSVADGARSGILDVFREELLTLLD